MKKERSIAVLLTFCGVLALATRSSSQGEIGPQRWTSLHHASISGSTTTRLDLQVVELRHTRP